MSWSKLSGWEQDHPADAWPALINSCKRLATNPSRSETPYRDAVDNALAPRGDVQGGTSPGARAGALAPRGTSNDPVGSNPWNVLCAEVQLFPEPDDATARAFFETRFVPHELVNGDGGYEGLITGYYEPLLYGSMVKTARYRYPIYRIPSDLIVVDLAELYPELQGKTIRGRLRDRRVVPYFSRAEITRGPNPLAGNEIVWVDDPVAFFFLQIQGSGRVQLSDNRTIFLGYADQNGHPYVAIGRTLVQMGALKLEEVSLQSIRDWLRTNPDDAETVLNSNPSYVFFTVRDPKLPGPVGSLNVPLTAQRSVAVDPRFIRLGSPVWIDTTLPTTHEEVLPYRRLMFAHDTGGAINGAVRADVFFGYGDEAEWFAGRMKQPGRMFILLPSGRNLSFPD